MPVIDAYEPSLIAARDACADFIAAMLAGEPPYWLTFAGRNGCGKSMLAEQIGETAARINPDSKSLLIRDVPGGLEPPRRRLCVWMDERSLARRMKEGEYDLPEYLADDFFVVLDEMGATRDPSNFVGDALSRFFQGRRDKWTVVTTNLNAAEIAERIDARITSRLIRDLNRIVTITARDYAFRKKQQ